MSFLYPTFLFALAAIAIPVIIHLFNFRRHKTVLFSSVKYLRNIKKETKAKSQLKHFLILLARIFVVAAMVLAFARPYIPVSGDVDANSEEIVSIYIDNSFSMDAKNKFGNIFEMAKSKVPQISDAFRPDTRFMLLTNDFRNKHSRYVNRNQLLEFISELELSPTARNLSEVTDRISDFTKNKNDGQQYNRMFILSDFQKSTNDFANLKNYENQDAVLVPLSTQQSNNMFIDSCWFESPGRKYNRAEELFARIVNNSNEIYNNTQIKLFINDSLKYLGSFTINARSEEVVKLSYTNTHKGTINGRIEISDYPVTYDNIFYFSYEVAEILNILSISAKAENRFVKALFSNDDYFNIVHNAENNINFSRFSGFHLIILSKLKNLPSGLLQEIEKYIANGGSVLFFPDIDGDIVSYNRMFTHFGSNKIISLDTNKTKVNKIDFKHPVFDDAFRKINQEIDLPEVFAHFIFENRTRTNDEEILTTIDGHSFLRKIGFAKGSFYISAVPLDIESSDFARHPIFVPAVYNMAFNSQGNTNLYYTIGNLQNVRLNIPNGSESKILHITDLSGEFDFIPEKIGSRASSNFRLSGQITKAGNYFMKSDNKKVLGLSFNYNRKESDLDYFSNKELNEQIETYSLSSFSILEGQHQQISDNIKELNEGRQLWKFFLLLALLFILTEVLLIKLMK
ncbi:MAG: BatA and WFA domain-containing protein [Bacteroidota bacterium]|nr:BatA and WFA domain-containing protein [Bacteroidota bacterium]